MYRKKKIKIESFIYVTERKRENVRKGKKKKLLEKYKILKTPF